MSRKFEYLRPKSGREMLIGQFDQVMTGKFLHNVYLHWVHISGKI